MTGRAQAVAEARPSGVDIGRLTATGMRLWVVENRIAMKRSQGVGSIANTNKRIIIRIDTDGGPSG